MDDKTKKELQSATFDRLIDHLRERKDVQKEFVAQKERATYGLEWLDLKRMTGLL